LFLDDIRPLDYVRLSLWASFMSEEEWEEEEKNYIVVRNIDDAKEVFNNYEVVFATLDNDMGVDSNGNLLDTGQDLCKWLSVNHKWPPWVDFHTANPIAALNMRSMQNSYIKSFPDSVTARARRGEYLDPYSLMGSFYEEGMKLLHKIAAARLCGDYKTSDKYRAQVESLIPGMFVEQGSAFVLMGRQMPNVEASYFGGVTYSGVEFDLNGQTRDLVEYNLWPHIWMGFIKEDEFEYVLDYLSQFKGEKKIKMFLNYGIHPFQKRQTQEHYGYPNYYYERAKEALSES